METPEFLVLKLASDRTDKLISIASGICLNYDFNITELYDLSHSDIHTICEDFAIKKYFSKEMSMNDQALNFRLTPVGEKVYKAESAKREKENEKENLSTRKLKLDVALGERVVADYPATKRKSNIAILISIIAVLIAAGVLVTRMIELSRDSSSG